jgi:hypothetical protein
LPCAQSGLGAPAESIAGETCVFVPGYSRDGELPGGRIFPVYTAVPGTREDLKAGQRVTVEWPPSEGRAARVSIQQSDGAAAN